jgi:tetratricopeptide (TPR) repeat protein
LYQQEEKEIAYNNYLYVIEQPVNDFTEPALFAAATIAYEQERYEEALQHYTDLERTAIFDENILEARIGQMRCHFQLGNKEETLTYSDVVIADDNSPEYITKEAYFFKAKTLLFLERTDEALVAFSWVDKESTGNMGAESRFNIARIHYNEESYDIAEEDVFSLIEDYPSQTFWKIKAFMLLADVYVAKEDYFQAKTTLQSIMDNVDDESVQSEAMEKFQAILEIEAQESEGVEEEMEIEYETVDPSDDGSQFDEEESE